MSPGGKSPTKPQKRMRHANWLITLVGTAMMIAVGITAYYYWPRPTPGMDAEAAVLIQFVASNQFAKLPVERQFDYINKLGAMPVSQLVVAAAHIPDAQRRAAFENGRSAWVAKRIGDYSRLKTKEQRRAYLDKVLDEMPALVRGNWFGGPGGKPMTPDAAKRWIESNSPARRAQASEFVADLVDRQKESNTR